MKISSENEQKKDADKVAYQDPNIVFMMEGESVYVGNIVYEKFARSIPMHAHSDNSYEIHYIPEGRGSAARSFAMDDSLSVHLSVDAAVPQTAKLTPASCAMLCSRTARLREWAESSTVAGAWT